MFRTLNLLGTLRRRRKRRRVGVPWHTCVFLPQDQVEAADGGGPGAAGRSWELLGPAEDVSIALFLPPEPAGQHGQHHGGRSSCGHVQQHVPDSARAPPPAAAAPGTPSAHPRLGSRGTAGLESLVQPYSWHPAPSVKKEPPRVALSPLPCPGRDSCPSVPTAGTRGAAAPRGREMLRKTPTAHLLAAGGPPKKELSFACPLPPERAAKPPTAA